MPSEENIDRSVLFTQKEIEIFKDDLLLVLSDEEIKSRIGDEIQSVEVLVGIDDNPPPGISDEINDTFLVSSDKENPTALIISREDDYFRIPRPKDYSSIALTIQDIIQRRQEGDGGIGYEQYDDD